MSELQAAPMTSEKRRSVLSMTDGEARAFFLKGESYCNFDLPPYFEFDGLLSKLDAFLRGKNLGAMVSGSPRKHDDLNHVILNNKDGRFAWRPLQLTHPALYVSLVHHLTEPSTWDLILKRFAFFARNPRIQCLSLPVESQSTQQDKAEQVLQWWQEVEQRSIELSLEYEYLAHTDIIDCFGSIYTHSVPWAVHRRSVMKRSENRTAERFPGNVIDHHLQDLNQGQTNGIPQGSVLMDFMAEIVLGYADFVLTAKLRKCGISDYRVLRYRDDYRIFANQPTHCEEILRAVSETMRFLGMKLQPLKTGITREVIRNSIKADKIEWIGRKQFEKDLEKQLLLIHDFSRKHPNSGSLMRAFHEFHRRVLRYKDNLSNVRPQISLAVDIALNSPKTYATTAAILSKLVCSIHDDKERIEILRKIKKRFERVPNTGHLQIWLQRISYHHDKELTYSEPLCKIAEGASVKIWNCDWISSKQLKSILTPSKILNRKTLESLKPIIQSDEIQLFESYSL